LTVRGDLALIVMAGTVVVPDDVAVAVAELAGQGGVGDQDREGSPGVGTTQPDALAADRDDTGVIGEPLHPDRLLRWPGWRAGGTCSAQPQDLLGRQRVGPGAQQRPGLQVEQQQGARLDTDTDLPAGQDRRPTRT
jgi:hypothetical protein